MKKLIVMAVAAMVAVGAMAGMGDSMFYGYANGAEFWLSGSQQSQNPDFNGYNLGEIYSLTLGAQIQSWPAGSEASNMRAGYQIYQGDTPSDNAWIDPAFTFTWIDDNGNNGNGRWATGGNWDSPAQTVIDLSGCTVGQDYHIAVYFAGTVAGQDTGDYENNFVASFTMAPTPVPEPATMSLLGLGALAMVIRRKLRK